MTGETPSPESTPARPEAAAPSAAAAAPGEAPPSVPLAAIDTEAQEKKWFWAIVAVYGVITFLTFDQIEEDAFIYYRVAAHIANFDGYVFNVGGERVEVGSSLTWQFLLAVVYWLPLDIVFSSKLLGVGFGAGSLYLLWRTSRDIIDVWWVRLLPSALLAATIPFHTWAQRGLETPLYVFAIILLDWTMVDEQRRRHWHWAALLVALSRSEGPIVLAGMLPLLYFDRANLGAHLRRMAVVIVALVAVQAGRFFYFHDLLPLPFYLKIQRSGAGADAVSAYFTITHSWLLIAVGAFGLANRRAWNQKLILLCCAGAPFLLWGLRTHGWQIYNRHLLPGLPLLYLLCARGIDLLSQRPGFALPARVGSFAFVFWIGLVAPGLSRSLKPERNRAHADLLQFFSSPGRHFSNVGAIVLGRDKPSVRPERHIGDTIGENWQYRTGALIARKYPEGTTVAYDQMGQCAWYAGLDKDFIDTWGLAHRATGYAVFNDAVKKKRSNLYRSYRNISRDLLEMFGPDDTRRYNLKQAVDHVFELDPDVIILNKLMVKKRGPGGGFVSSHVPGLIAQDPRLKERYTERKRWTLLIYERHELAAQVDWSEEEAEEARIAEMARKMRVNALKPTDSPSSEPMTEEERKKEATRRAIREKAKSDPAFREKLRKALREKMKE